MRTGVFLLGALLAGSATLWITLRFPAPSSPGSEVPRAASVPDPSAGPEAPPASAALREAVPVLLLTFAVGRGLVYDLDLHTSFLVRRAEHPRDDTPVDRGAGAPEDPLDDASADRRQEATGDGPSARPEEPFAAPLFVGVEGPLIVCPLDARDGQTVVAFSLRNACLTTSSPMEGAAASQHRELEGLSRDPFLVRFDANGLPLAIHFADTQAAEARNLARVLLQSLRLGGLLAREGTFVREERDLSSRHRARYEVRRIESGLWRCVRSKYEPRPHESGRFGAALIPEVHLQGHATALVDASLGVWREASSRERVTLVVPALGLEIHGTSRLEANLQRVLNPVDFPASLRRGDPWAGPWSDPDLPDSPEASSDEITPRFHDVDSFAAALGPWCQDPTGKGMISGEALALLAETTAWILRDPHAARAVEDAIRGGRLDPPVSRMLSQALAQAGTENAQESLASLARDTLLDPAARNGVLQSLFSVEAPQAALLDATLVAAGETGRGSVPQTALLVAGALAARSEERDAAAVVIDAILARESQEVRAGRVASWLGALGNTRSAMAAAAALPYLESPNDSVREAAIHALAMGGDEAHLAAIARQAEREQSGPVARAAVQALARGWQGIGRAAVLRYASRPEAYPLLGSPALEEARRHARDGAPTGIDPPRSDA